MVPATLCQKQSCIHLPLNFNTKYGSLHTILKRNAISGAYGLTMSGHPSFYRTSVGATWTKTTHQMNRSWLHQAGASSRKTIIIWILRSSICKTRGDYTGKWKQGIPPRCAGQVINIGIASLESRSSRSFQRTGRDFTVWLHREGVRPVTSKPALRSLRLMKMLGGGG